MTDADALAAAAASLKVVRGSVDEEELAALLAGMVAVSAAALDEEPGAPTSAWMDRSRSMQGHRPVMPLARGDSAWRTSLR